MHHSSRNDPDQCPRARRAETTSDFAQSLGKIFAEWDRDHYFVWARARRLIGEYSQPSRMQIPNPVHVQFIFQREIPAHLRCVPYPVRRDAPKQDLAVLGTSACARA